MARLTQRIVDRVHAPGRYQDNDPKGLELRIYESGTKVWNLRFSLRGRVHSQTLGPANEMSLRTARIIAKDYKEKIRQGYHPTKDFATTGLTLNELVEQFLDKYADVYLKPSTAKHYRYTYTDVIRKHPIGKRMVRDLKRADFAEFHQSMADTPYQANRVLATLSSMFTWADDNGLVQESWNPVRGIKKFKEKERKRLLTDEEKDRLLAAVIDYPHRQASMIVRLLYFTGARVGEILSLRWEEVRTDAGLIHKEDSKTGERTILLNQYAEAVLREARKWAGKSEWVFPAQESIRKPYTYNAFRAHWRKITELADLKGLRIHDLRHNYGSTAAKQGLSLPMIGELLGHKQMSTTKRYVHFSVDHLRKQAEDLAHKL